VARDVADIRTQIFEREDRAAPWRSQFGWSRGPEPPVRILNPHVMVGIGGSVPTRETVYPLFPAGDLLFMTSEQMEMLIDAVEALGEQRPGGPPRMPRDMVSFLAAHVPVHGGMLGGIWSFASRPEVVSVTFTDEDRTMAEVGIRAYFSGGTLLMEKREGSWRVTGVGLTYVN